MTRKFRAENPTVLKNTYSNILFSEIYSKLLIYFTIDLTTEIEIQEKSDTIGFEQINTGQITVLRNFSNTMEGFFSSTIEDLEN